ncbi:MAG: M81 family metallopeptidase [Deltaproteobacteria bacterium]|nr:M81 family metallopeptidase [Deltaproteobacteria bacterium]
MFGMKLGRGPRPLRIAYGRLFHEANARSPVLTERADFDRMHHLAGDELARACGLRGTELKSFMPHAELTGFRQAARLAGNVETVPLTSALAVPGGPLSRACWNEMTGELLDALRDAGRLDGVYLALHGSMEVEGLDEAPEAWLLREVRRVVGSKVKIAVSYDLHANLSSGLVDPVDVLVAYRTNPHWDLAPTGFRAGNRLIRALRGEITPVHAWRKLPMVLGGGNTIDFLEPMRGVFRAMRAMEKDPRVVSASLFMVHPYTTAEHLGWAVHVCTNGDAALANELVDGFTDRVWEQRKSRLPPMLSVDEGLVAARKVRREGLGLGRLGPAIFVDVDDIVGAGAPGGNTRIATAFLAKARDLVAFVPVHDPALVAELWSAREGSRHDVVLRGTPGYHMPPLALDVTVSARSTGDFGRMVRLDVRHAEGGALHLVVTDGPPLPIHPSFWRAVGLDARAADVIVQKNFFHYRLFYATTAFSHFPVATGGATSFDQVIHARGIVPTEPATSLLDWREADPILRRPKRARTPMGSASPSSA